MTNVSEGDSPLLHIVLERIDAVRNVARYYVLSIEPTLFAKHTLIGRWGRVGSAGRERLRFFGGKDAAGAQMALETWLARKRKRGYAPKTGPACPALPPTKARRLNPLVPQRGFALGVRLDLRRPIASGSGSAAVLTAVASTPIPTLPGGRLVPELRMAAAPGEDVARAGACFPKGPVRALPWRPKPKGRRGDAHRPGPGYFRALPYHRAENSARGPQIGAGACGRVRK
jgi:predicted DNA-binding WGR domain protein